MRNGERRLQWSVLLRRSSVPRPEFAGRVPLSEQVQDHQVVPSHVHIGEEREYRKYELVCWQGKVIPVALCSELRRGSRFIDH